MRREKEKDKMSEYDKNYRKTHKDEIKNKRKLHYERRKKQVEEWKRGKNMEKLLDYYPLASKILVVAIKGQINDWSAYIEPVVGINHENEAKEIMRERKGTKIPYEIAKILFPNIASEYVWRN